MKYISTKLYRKMLDHAMREGLEAGIFEELPTPMSRVDSLQAVPADHFFFLHEFIDARVVPGFSVRVGQEMKIEDYGVLGLSWRTCSRAGEIFERSERYFKLLSNTYVFEVEQERHISRVYLNRPAHRRGVELSNEATISATVVVMQAMTETTIAPVQVTFQHGPPADMASYNEAFQCEVLFNQPRTSISYTTQDFNTRTAVADANINNFLMQRVDEEANGIQVNVNQLIADVTGMIKDALPSGIPGIHEIGKQLGMSNRTLTRRLSENDTTYRDLIKSTQEEVARSLLKNSNQSIAEIAFQTGFSEQSAFSRAFKRWTGVSPLEYRNS